MSKFLNLHQMDIVKGVITAILSAGLTAIYTTINSGGVINRETLHASIMVGIAGGLSYIIKNVFTNSNGELLKAEPTPLPPTQI